MRRVKDNPQVIEVNKKMQELNQSIIPADVKEFKKLISYSQPKMYAIINGNATNLVDLLFAFDFFNERISKRKELVDKKLENV